MNSYIPLLAVQQRRHSIVYRMPAREFPSSAEATAASAAARARLRRARPPEPMATIVEPPELLTPDPTPAQPATLPGGVPLNMLTMCHWRFLVALSAVRHGCTAEDILGRDKPKELAAARHEAVYLVTLHTSYSLARIGRMFGRDHTTLIHSLKKFPPIVRERASAYASAPPIKSREIEERVRTVQRGYASGLSVGAIAKQIGMSNSTVKHIAMRHGIRHPSRPFFGAETEAGAAAQ